ncbi:TRAP transporter large permease [Pelagibius sp. Alg239-R121]|uniref:TRAP transporter large permease n=1 Tax=Pelagibius sp. Alg239-R121 TaxID=2993448 RepID=UPI0024A7328B|nr:TRAP transporter large permease [Pelagibius sp. Alg239-R121]
MAATLLIIAVTIMIVIGVPVAASLALGSLVFVLFQGLPDFVVIHRMVSGVDSFPLLAIPFFIFAGNLMNSSAITDRIFLFASALLGWARGGLCYVNVGASVIFAGMSGAAVADAGGLGAIEIKAMRDRGYGDRLSVGVTAASSIIGPLIPPSLPMIIVGFVGNISIGKLFVAGFMPGLLMAVCLSAMIYFIAKRNNLPRDGAFSFSGVRSSFNRAFLSLLTPIIIVGGILGGLFTPTEAAIAASAYAILLGLVVYRTLDLSGLWRASRETAEMTASILFIVSAASIFAWILTSERIAEQFSVFVFGFTEDPLIILLLINLLLLLVGCFLETIAAISILTPVLLPIAVQAGIDPVQFGVMMVLNLMIGLLTPPLGMVLYVLSAVSGISLQDTIKGTVPFLIPLLATLLLVTFIPAVSLWLPALLGF